MARYLFGTQVVFRPPTDDGTVRVAQDAEFTLWSASQGGEQITDVTAKDGASPIELITDATGQRPELCGPDGVKSMFCDAGSGERYPMYSTEAMEWLLEYYEGPMEPTGNIHGGTF